MTTTEQYKKGFTLIEFLIVLSILAILLTMAVSVGRDFIVKNTLSTETEALASALHYSRHQAGLLGKTLTLVSKPEGWSSGMWLFIDKNANHTYEKSDDALLYQWEWNHSDISLNWQGLYANYLLFTPTGINSVLGGTFDICPINMTSVSGKSITMNRLGRIRVDENQKTCNTSL